MERNERKLKDNCIGEDRIMLGQRYLYDGKSIMYLNERQKESCKRIINGQEKENPVYQFEDFKCECGAGEEAFDVLAEKDRYGLKSRTVICRKCGLVMTNPRMTQESYDYFYDKEFGKLYRDHDKMDEKYFMTRVEEGQGIYNFIKSNYDGEIKDVLEIGCAAGGILYYFDYEGCNVTGCDLGSDYISYGQRLGMDLRQCHSKELLKDGKKYDLIILNQVLEHFLNIEQELDVICKLLKEDGILFVAVPGIKALVSTYQNDFMRYLQNAHVYDFTLGTLEQVMNKYGFELVYGTEIVDAIFKYTGVKRKIENNYFLDIMSFLYQLENLVDKRDRQ